MNATAGDAPTFSDLAAFSRRYAPDPDADRTVTAKVETIGDLAGLLDGQLRKVWDLAPDRPMGRQELTCAADVAEALDRTIREASDGDPRPPGPMPPLARLIDIPVIISPDSAPGSWRLVTHDGCEVRNLDGPGKAWVSCARCSITAEGCLG